MQLFKSKVKGSFIFMETSSIQALPFIVSCNYRININFPYWVFLAKKKKSRRNTLFILYLIGLVASGEQQHFKNQCRPTVCVSSASYSWRDCTLGRLCRSAGIERFQSSPFPLIKGNPTHIFFPTSKFFSPYSMLCKAQRGNAEIRCSD